MLVWGGQDGLGPLGNGGRYDPVGNGWAVTSIQKAPSRRDSQRAVWADGFMLVWGGQDVTSALSTGGRYALGQTADQDFDTYQHCADCDDTNGAVWTPPGEATGLTLAHQGGVSGTTTFAWSPPADIGGTASIQFDLLRSANPRDFQGPAFCLLTDAAPGIPAIDSANPAAGTIFFYLVRAQNPCPFRDGALGDDSSGAPRAGRACP